MVRLLGRPLMEHIIALLRESGLRQICVTLCSQPEAVRGYFGSGEKFGVEISYREETVPLGTAGGVKNCARLHRRRRRARHQRRRRLRD